jgi:hypothetical protein
MTLQDYVLKFVDMPRDLATDDGVIGPLRFKTLGEALGQVMAYVGPRTGSADYAEKSDDELIRLIVSFFLMRSGEPDVLAAVSVLGPDVQIQCGSIEILCRSFPGPREHDYSQPSP